MSPTSLQLFQKNLHALSEKQLKITALREINSNILLQAIRHKARLSIKTSILIDKYVCKIASIIS